MASDAGSAKTFLFQFSFI